MNPEYKITVGLEIHAELSTKTKMFCNSKNDPDETEPNANICPVCMGHPGTLPVINKQAVKYVIKVGRAVGGIIADFTEFDRKNYFYPDISKGYQISQYKYPLVSGGELAGVKLTRIHLEEDTARSSHETGDYSLVDFNRAGVPLMELVTEPVIHSAKEASNFAKELQLLLRYLGVSEANMEKGEMRVEVNVSVSKTDAFGTKVEVKNINSFRAAERAIEYEAKRHIELLDEGKEVVQETRGWDENKQITFSQRKKEDSHDYRYFPEPDLPKLYISHIPEFSAEAIMKEMPELPWQKRDRYQTFGLKEEDIETLVAAPAFSAYFDSVIECLNRDSKQILLAINYFTSDYLGLLKGNGSDELLVNKIAPAHFAKVISMNADGKLSSRGAKDLLMLLWKEDGDPEMIAGKNNLIQQSDEGAILEVVKTVIAENKVAVDEYKAGKEASIQFLIGQVMKKSKGAANPVMARELLVKNLQ